MTGPTLKEKRKVQITKEDRQQRDDLFVEMIANNISPLDAALALGYSPGGAEHQGYKLKRRLQSRIIERSVEKLNGMAIKALREIKEIALHGKKASVRLKACQDLLDRAGLRPPTKVETVTTVTNSEMTTQELEAELQSLLGTVRVEALEQLETSDDGKVTYLPTHEGDEDWTPPENLQEMHIGDVEVPGDDDGGDENLRELEVKS